MSLDKLVQTAGQVILRMGIMVLQGTSIIHNYLLGTVRLQTGPGAPQQTAGALLALVVDTVLATNPVREAAAEVAVQVQTRGPAVVLVAQTM
jgi:hypothetical protein